MVERCVKDGLSYRFFDIQWDAQDKKWIAWFYPEKDDAKDVL